MLAEGRDMVASSVFLDCSARDLDCTEYSPRFADASGIIFAAGCRAAFIETMGDTWCLAFCCASVPLVGSPSGVTPDRYLLALRDF